jgi:hypothetical protein
VTGVQTCALPIFKPHARRFVPCVAVCESTNRFARTRISSSYDDISLTVTPKQKEHKFSVTVDNNNKMIIIIIIIIRPIKPVPLF